MRLAAFLCLAAVAANAAIYVPKTSRDQMLVSPLHHGELCWLENANKTAEAYVGGVSGDNLRIVDSSALRGYRVRELGLDEYSVSAGGNFEQLENGTWRVECSRGDFATNTIVVTVKSGQKIAHAGSHDEGNPIGGNTIGSFPYWRRIQVNGNTAIFSFVSKSNHDDPTPSPQMRGEIIVKGFTIRVQDEETVVNDTATITWMIRDSLGTYDLRSLRKWLLAYYDGDRGHDWAQYAATNAVRLADQRLIYDRDRQYMMGVNSSTNLEITAAGRQVMEIVTPHGGSEQYTRFEISAIVVDHTNDTVVITYVQDIQSFNRDNLIVMYSDDLHHPFYPVVRGTDWWFDGQTIRVRSFGRQTGFWKLQYNGLLTSALRVRTTAPLHVEDGLYIRQNGTLYKITISGSSLSATPVQE